MIYPPRHFEPVWDKNVFVFFVVEKDNKIKTKWIVKNFENKFEIKS